MNEINANCSIAISQRIIFWCNNQSFSFPSSPVDDLADINEVLRFFENPVDLIIISCAGIDHDVFVSVEEHECHLIIELIHGVEIGYLGDIGDIESDKVAQFVGHFSDDLVHDHTRRVPIVPESNDN